MAGRHQSALQAGGWAGGGVITRGPAAVAAAAAVASPEGLLGGGVGGRGGLRPRPSPQRRQRPQRQQGVEVAGGLQQVERVDGMGSGWLGCKQRQEPGVGVAGGQQVESSSNMWGHTASCINRVASGGYSGHGWVASSARCRPTPVPCGPAPPARALCSRSSCQPPALACMSLRSVARPRKAGPRGPPLRSGSNTGGRGGVSPCCCCCCCLAWSAWVVS